MRRRVSLLAAACAVSLTACAAPVATAAAVPPVATAATATATPAATSTATPVEIPDTPLGDALRWVLDASTRAPVGESELRTRIAPEFLAAVPAEQFDAVLTAYPDLSLRAVSVAHAAALVAGVESGGKRFLLELSVDGAGLINGMRLTEAPAPQPAPKSWKELERRLRAVAPRAGFVAARVDGRACRTVRGVAADVRRPLGSMFKLYVLGTVAGQIEKGAYGWDTELTITADVKSLPTGQLQDRPDGSRVTVLEAARLMISISDNTATDLLIRKAGREAVERTMRSWTKGHDRRNTPLLTTRELFVLKGARYPELAERYLSMNTRDRRDYLAKVVAKVPLSDIRPWTHPRELDTIEWFASPEDVCRAHAALSGLGDERVDEIMSANDAGLGLPPDRWRSVWFKGGSEPGVYDMGFRARTTDGRTYAVTLMGVNPDAPFDDGKTGQEFLALARGAFALAARGAFALAARG
ncbi:serine hydrolase [Nonomuraea sp. C10]|uniref:serine hydrolase n=1 Tax=Nonomuraea sp. C10 TaxID=2600577 RepID=UPI001650D368|nr:serine hydrolase [Nonomuraea sp. C10]